MKFNNLIKVVMICCFVINLNAKDKIILTLHHFISPQGPTHKMFLKPWANKINKQTNGKIEIKIFPSMTLGGKPSELYKQVRDGSVDIAWTVLGYTPGVFPRSEIYELPTVHNGSSLATNLAIQDEFEMIKDDFKDIHPILVHVHAGNALHTRGKKISNISDVKGLKLRSPSRTGVWFIKEIGAEPVGMPLPSVVQALSSNGINGALLPFQVFPSLKLHQLTKYSTSTKNDTRFGTAVFLLAMNKKSYRKLPNDLKKIIDENSGRNLAKIAGQLWLDIEKPGKDLVTQNGQITNLDKKATSEFKKAGLRVEKKWIKEIGKKGIDGKKMIEKAQKAIKNNTK